MTSTAKASFDITSWEEEPYDEEEPKLVRCRIRCG
jgi:hypothetical protein